MNLTNATIKKDELTESMHVVFLYNNSHCTGKITHISKTKPVVTIHFQYGNKMQLEDVSLNRVLGVYHESGQYQEFGNISGPALKVV